MNPLLRAALVGALGGIGGQLDSAAQMMRDRDLPLKVRLQRAETIIEQIAEKAGPAGDVLGALAELLEEAREVASMA